MTIMMETIADDGPERRLAR